MTGYLLALFVYLWAGYWIARPFSKNPLAGVPGWVGIATFVITWLGWGLLFPLHQVFSKQRNPGASP